MDIFFEIHKNLPREGPGNNESTRRAFGLLENLPVTPLILDIGCGPGMQTLELARISNGKIIALDTHQPFLDQLRSQSLALGLNERIQIINGSMFEMEFPQQSFDILWCEGAIYIIGFEQGAKTWRPLLKTGGYLAVTEISWLRPDPPREVHAYWNSEYPGMRSVDQNIELLQKTGYRVAATFCLPDESWWTDYYNPILARLSALRGTYQSDPKAVEMIDASQKEIDIFRQYSNWYGYVFYVAQAI